MLRVARRRGKGGVRRGGWLGGDPARYRRALGVRVNQNRRDDGGPGLRGRGRRCLVGADPPLSRAGAYGIEIP